MKEHFIKAKFFSFKINLILDMKNEFTFLFQGNFISKKGKSNHFLSKFFGGPNRILSVFAGPHQT